jgi:hypothetical protein
VISTSARKRKSPSFGLAVDNVCVGLLISGIVILFGENRLRVKVVQWRVRWRKVGEWRWECKHLIFGKDLDLVRTL